MLQTERSFDYVKINLASPSRIRSWGERTLPNGEIIGEVASTSSTEITLVNEPAKTTNTHGFYTSQLFRITLPDKSILSGNATEDTSLHGNLIHMNKGAIVDANDYGESGSAFHTRHSETFRNMLLQKANEVGNEARRPSIILPVDLGKNASFVEITGTTTSGDPNVTSVSTRDIKVVSAGEYVQVSAIPHGTVVDTVSSTAFSLEDEDTTPSAVNATASGSRAINVTRDSQRFSETIIKVILPSALPGIIGSFLLAISRAIGETMIVVMAASLQANLTINPLEPATTITTQIVTALTGDTEFDNPKTLVAFALGLTLFFITLFLNYFALKIVKKYREIYD